MTTLGNQAPAAARPDRSVKDDGAPRRALLDAAGLLQGVSKDQPAAVAARELLAVDLYRQVIDPEPSRRRQQVLDRRDAGPPAQHDAALGGHNLGEAGRNRWSVRHVHPGEDHALVRRCGQQPYRGGRAGMEPNPGDPHGPDDGALRDHGAHRGRAVNRTG